MKFATPRYLPCSSADVLVTCVQMETPSRSVLLLQRGRVATTKLIAMVVVRATVMGIAIAALDLPVTAESASSTCTDPGATHTAATTIRALEMVSASATASASAYLASLERLARDVLRDTVESIATCLPSAILWRRATDRDSVWGKTPACARLGLLVSTAENVRMACLERTATSVAMTRRTAAEMASVLATASVRAWKLSPERTA
eukprot:3933971-Rhodomonas_salina.1